MTLLHLPEMGIRGNTHFPFSDLNNLEIADQLSKFFAEKVAGLMTRLVCLLRIMTGVVASGRVPQCTDRLEQRSASIAQFGESASPRIVTAPWS